MRCLSRLALLALCSTAVGCFVSSIHPLADEGVSVMDDEIVGKWQPYHEAFQTVVGDVQWRIEKGEAKEYTLRVSSDEQTWRYKLCVVGLGGCRYWDIQLADGDDPAENIGSVRVHQFFQVNVQPDRLCIRSLVPANVFVDVAKKSNLPFAEVEGRILLTGSTDELQAFFRTHGNVVFQTPSTIFKRVKQ